jgi:FkbM family methyltransferase
VSTHTPSPLQGALSKAPTDDEPESEEELAEVGKALEEVERWRAVSSAELRRRLRPRFLCPASLQPHCQSIFRGEYDFPRLEFEPPPVILDIGACVGAYALWALERWPGATVHCYEPWPDNFRLLRENGRSFSGASGHLELHNVAVSGRWQSGDMHPGANNCGEASFYDLGEQDLSPERSVRVNMLALEALPRADIVKVDTEGCELDIIEGILTTPMLPLPRAITFEWHRERDRWRLGSALSTPGGYECVSDVVRRQDRGVMKWLRREHA